MKVYDTIDKIIWFNFKFQQKDRQRLKQTKRKIVITTVIMCIYSDNPHPSVHLTANSEGIASKFGAVFFVVEAAAAAPSLLPSFEEVLLKALIGLASAHPQLLLRP